MLPKRETLCRGLSYDFPPYRPELDESFGKPGQEMRSQNFAPQVGPRGVICDAFGCAVFDRDGFPVDGEQWFREYLRRYGPEVEEVQVLEAGSWVDFDCINSSEDFEPGSEAERRPGFGVRVAD